MKEEDIKGHLDSHTFSNVPEEIDSNTLKAVLDSEIETPKSTKSLMYLWVSAAVVIAALGFSFWKWQDKNVAPENRERIEYASAKDEIYILYSDQNEQTLTAQLLDDFSFKRVQPNERLGKFTYLGLQDIDIVLTSESNSQQQISISKWNEEAMVVLEGEIEALQTLGLSDTITDIELQRLSSIALFGAPSAFSALQSIAQAGVLSSTKADAFLVANQQESLVVRLQELASKGADKQRRMALRGLSDTGSPLAVEALRKFALGSDRTTAMFAIEMLGHSRDHAGIGMLQQISKSVSDESLSAAAEKAIRTSLRDIK